MHRDARRKRSWLVMLAIAAVLGLVVVLAFLALLWWQQERVVFQPPGPPWPDADGTRRIEYTTADGQKLFAFVVGDESVPRGVLIAFHGNADLAVRQIGWAREVARRTGWTVFVAEYRGYGGASGAPSYAGSSLDAHAAYATVRDSLRVEPARIALFGHSLGSAIATELAREVEPCVLLLQSPFTSARDMARIIIARPLVLAWNTIARVHFDTESHVRVISSPVWVAHGARDLIIPVRMGRAVHAAAATRGELLIVDGAGHNDVPQAGGDAYWRWIDVALMR